VNVIPRQESGLKVLEVNVVWQRELETAAAGQTVTFVQLSWQFQTDRADNLVTAGMVNQAFKQVGFCFFNL
jgi:hypothetical protein